MIDPFEFPDEVLDEINSPYFEEQLDNYDEIKGLWGDNEEDVNPPTKEMEDYWIYAAAKKCKKFTKRSGKWLCFVPEKHIDAAWEQVKDATEGGLLGGKSKVSTKRGKISDDYVICVYTRDWKDEGDVMRVRAALRELGFEKPIPYKTDADTRAKKYAKDGHKGLAKYFE